MTLVARTKIAASHCLYPGVSLLMKVNIVKMQTASWFLVTVGLCKLVGHNVTR